MSDQISGTFTSRCFICGGPYRVVNTRARKHFCRLHWLRRLRWSSYLEGWHDAHRWAVENPDDPMVLADARDYGSGWAGFMRRGGGAVELEA